MMPSEQVKCGFRVLEHEAGIDRSELPLLNLP
jgi:hypothetical protein